MLGLPLQPIRQADPLRHDGRHISLVVRPTKGMAHSNRLGYIYPRPPFSNPNDLT
jgi:hypothetical protein